MAKKILKTILIVTLLAFLVAATVGYRAKQKLAAYCHETTPGTPMVNAVEKAGKMGFHYFGSSCPQGNTCKAFVTSGGVMGRIVCEIEYNDGRIVKTSLNVND